MNDLNIYRCDYKNHMATELAFDPWEAAEKAIETLSELSGEFLTASMITAQIVDMPPEKLMGIRKQILKQQFPDSE